MREIKFRAWDNQEKKMVGWDFIKEFPLRQLEDFKSGYMQYTGLKDKNGKEIYEGDIIQYALDIVCKECGHNEKPKVASVEWDDFGFWKKSGGAGQLYMNHNQKTGNFKNGVCEYLEIIGNIYEHPNLLN